jgi:hypothetical protein
LDGIWDFGLPLQALERRVFKITNTSAITPATTAAALNLSMIDQASMRCIEDQFYATDEQ